MPCLRLALLLSLLPWIACGGGASSGGGLDLVKVGRPDGGGRDPAALERGDVRLPVGPARPCPEPPAARPGDGFNSAGGR